MPPLHLPGGVVIERSADDLWVTHVHELVSHSKRLAIYLAACEGFPIAEMVDEMIAAESRRSADASKKGLPAVSSG